MGKSTKPTKWFKAVKKAFRSPSKERPPPDQSPKADQGDEKQLLTKHDFPPQAHPLPLFEIINHELVGSERVIQTPQKALLLPQSPKREDKKVLEQEEETHDHQLGDVGDNATFNEEEEDEEDEEEAAATTIQQRFLTIPLAMKGLVRLQALVRGHLVRRQAAATLRTMKAIVRVQAVFRGRRVRMSKDGRAVRSRASRAHRPSSRITNGVVHDENKVEIVGSEVAEHEEASKRQRTTEHLITQQLKRTTPNHSSNSSIDYDPQKGWAWLELWTKSRPWDHNNNTRQGDSDSKDSYIEINPNQSQYTTKEVDVNTKVKYYEDYISDLALKKTNFSSRLMKKEQFKPAHIPMQIEVPYTKEEDQKASTREMMAPSSSLNSEGDGIASPQGSDSASVCHVAVCHVSEMAGPRGSDAAAASVCHVEEFGGGHEPSCEGVVMEQLVVHHVGSNGGADPALSDSLSVCNGVHHVQGEDHALGLASDDAAAAIGHASDDVANGHITSNGHGNNQVGKEDNHVTTGSKSRGMVTCRYMAATKSAKAKFRSSSNPKSRTDPESPTITKRYSTGSSGPTNQSPKLVTSKSNNRRRSQSPVVSKEFHNLSPSKRNSLGGDGKRWRT